MAATSTTINHAGHPHPLELREQGTAPAKFRCALCKCHGNGASYRCASSSCAYRVHDTCASCPATLSFFGHPEHPLALDPVIKADSGFCCRLCEFCIHGIHYACRACSLFLRPVCATLPAATISPLHPQQLVALVPTKADVVTKCSVCRCRCGSSSGWHYECSPCGFRLHPWCLLGDKENSAPLCIRGPGGDYGEYD